MNNLLSHKCQKIGNFFMFVTPLSNDVPWDTMILVNNGNALQLNGLGTR